MECSRRLARKSGSVFAAPALTDPDPLGGENPGIRARSSLYRRPGEGPFRCWKHRHQFESNARDGQGGTLVRDDLEFEVGFGLLGSLCRRTWRSRIICEGGQVEGGWCPSFACDEHCIRHLVGVLSNEGGRLGCVEVRVSAVL